MNRRRQHKRSYGRVIWNVAQLGAIVGIAVFSGLKAYEYSREQQYLVVKRVDVTGNSRVATEELLDLAQVPMGVALYSAETEAIERGVRTHPDIATALVRRVPPDTLVIEVTEHTGVATVAVGQGVYLVNRDGHLFRRAQAGETVDLPVITGIPRNLFGTDPPAAEALMAEAVAALKAYEHSQRPLQSLAEIEMTQDIGVTLRLGDLPTEVVLGRGNLDEKMARLAVLEKHLARQRQQAARIFLDDSRHPERVSLLLHNPLLAVSGDRSRTGAGLQP